MKAIIKIFLFAIIMAATSTARAELQDFAGQPHKLTDYTGQGKWTVVMLWASDCHVCNAEAEQYIQFHEARKQKDASVLGISLDGQSKKQAAAAFIQRHHVTFPNLIGEPDEVVALFESLTGGTWAGTPTFLVYNPKGELKAAQPGAVPTELIIEFIEKQSQVSTK